MWHDFSPKIKTSGEEYTAKLQFQWSPIAKSLEKTGEETILCASQPLQLKGILTIDTMKILQNVVWEQNLDGEVDTRMRKYCLCTIPQCGYGEYLATEKDRYGNYTCNSGYIPIEKPPTNPDTIWTVIPNQTGSILNITTPNFGYWDEYDFVRRVKYRYYIFTLYRWLLKTIISIFTLTCFNGI